MKHDEIRAAGRLATGSLTDAVSYVEHVHAAVATRAFMLTAPFSLPVRLAHDGITAGVYAVLREVGVGAGMVATEVFVAAGGSARSVGSTPRSNLASAMLNAILGDELASQASPLAIPMEVRLDRADVSLRPDALAAAFPEATSKVAVFLHGLGETEESWRLHADRQGRDRECTYGSRLAEDLGYTPVYLRYNTGLHISENGRRLAELLDELLVAWPVEVAELVLVGHSMGGLVARSGCHHAWERGDSWVSTVRHVFYLGSPHLGAGLEQWVNRCSDILGKLEESRPLATILNRRSAGIKDLRIGRLLDDSGRCTDDEEQRQRDDVPLLPWANHYAISATVTTSRHNPLGRLLGDLLVQPASARGRTRYGSHIPFPDEHKRHFEGLHHFRLLNHPSIYQAMREWLEVEPTSCVEPGRHPV